ncbi:MAG: hypothetical protein CO170_04610 [candidate division SR1 bacterium CG_4_9_14_3_um_filter_40_9]|nr:MAG: hypothetical protein CO170_04610 [candidate division SR1 bacterium CG_4_9_14_3_um_filter_40_9]
MVLGLFYLLVYAKFDATWNIVFPIIGYLCTLKGIALMTRPKFVINGSKLVYNNKKKIVTMGVLMLVMTLFVLRVALVKF